MKARTEEQQDQARFDMVDKALDAARQEEERAIRGAGDEFIESGVFLPNDDAGGYPSGFAWVVGEATAAVMFSSIGAGGAAETAKVFLDCTTSSVNAVEALATRLLAMARRYQTRVSEK